MRGLALLRSLTITFDRSLVIQLARQFRNTEQLVHFLKCKALRFRYKEPGEDSHGTAKACEEDESAVATDAPIYQLAT